MLNQISINQISLHRISLFQKLPTSDLAKLEAISAGASYQAGETIFNQGGSAHHFYVVVEGEVQISRKIDSKEIRLANFGKDTFFGEVPILAGEKHLASGVALSDTNLRVFSEANFWQMLFNYPSIRKVILGQMAEHFQELQTQSIHHEKLIGLGTLAAGLAHELNNPASAASSAITQLKDLFPQLYIEKLKCIEQSLTSKQLQDLIVLKQNALAQTLKKNEYSPLKQLDLEDELTVWLEEHNVSQGWQFAPDLVAAGVTVQQLSILNGLNSHTLNYIFTCLESSLAQASLLRTLQASVERISEIVGAVKSYSYVDRSPLEKQKISIFQGLNSTLVILNYKLKQHNVEVERYYAADMPPIEANGSSLNQVWTNLIDNAIDAVSEQRNGKITITTTTEDNNVLVTIADNGVGIPPEIQKRIFEPFFTTKDIGEGTGIGLDLVYRIIVIEHQGKIDYFSEPGKTEFTIELPIYPFLET